MGWLRDEYERATRRQAEVPLHARFMFWSEYSRKIRDQRKRMETGRRIASERDDLIASGVDPADLLIPLAPFDREVGHE